MCDSAKSALAKLFHSLAKRKRGGHTKNLDEGKGISLKNEEGARSVIQPNRLWLSCFILWLRGSAEFIRINEHFR